MAGYLNNSNTAKSTPEQRTNDTVREGLPQASHSLEDAREYPDGGTAAWVTVFGCFCSFFAALSMMNSASVYQDWISTHQLRGSSSGSIGWIFGLYNFLSLFSGVFIGPVFDAKGPKVIAVGGSFLVLLTYVLLAWCTLYWHFLVCFGALGSTATALLFTAAIGSVQHWFWKRRGLATGLAICGGSVGGIVCPLILGALLPKIGFAWTMRVLALTMVPFVVCAVFLMRSRIDEMSEGPPSSIFPDLRILLDRRRAVLTMGALFIELGLFVPMTYVASFAVSKGMSLHSAYITVTLMNVGSLIGRWLPGWVADRIGRFNMLIIALVLCLASILGLWLPPTGATSPGLTAFAVIFGIGAGSGISLVPVCVGQLCETRDYGKTFTAVYSIGSIGYDCGFF